MVGVYKSLNYVYLTFTCYVYMILLYFIIFYYYCKHGKHEIMIYPCTKKHEGGYHVDQRLHHLGVCSLAENRKLGQRLHVRFWKGIFPTEATNCSVFDRFRGDLN